MTTGEILKRVNARLELGRLNVDVQLVLLALKDVLLNQEENYLRLATLRDRVAKLEGGGKR